MKYVINEQSDFLCHHGIKGQKWGERRFQNEDGTLTPEGKQRYKKYLKTYGEDTARRIIKSMNQGLSEKQALRKEYRNRKYGAFKYAPAALGAAAGTRIAGVQLYRHGYKNVGQLVGNVGPIISAAAVAYAGKKAHQLNNGYSNFELTSDGLNYFYNKAKLYE